MTHELYIDGVLADLPQEVDITLEISSNLFRDITDITTNNTYTISLPRTAHNLAMIGHSDKAGMAGDYPYTFHDCEYRRNGVPIIKGGRASVDDREDDINVTIYWGLFPLLETLVEEDKNLDELGGDEVYVDFNKSNELTGFEEFKEKGLGYANYTSTRRKESDEEWTSGTLDASETETEQYDWTEGRKMYCGSEKGEMVSVSAQEDSGWRCLLVDSFEAGDKATFKAMGSEDYRAYAVLDEAGEVLTIASWQDDYEGVVKDYEVEAPVGAAVLVVNTRIAEGVSEKVTVERYVHGGWFPDGNQSGGVFGGGNQRVRLLQPSVTCRWLLDKIRERTGVTFDYGEANEEYLRTLAVPITDNESDGENTTGELKGSLEWDALGVARVKVTQGISCVKEGEGTWEQLTITQSVKMRLYVTFKMRANTSGWRPSGTKTWEEDGEVKTDEEYFVRLNYILVSIQRRGEEARTFEVGYSDLASIWGSSFVGDTWTGMGYGTGDIDVNEGDVITFTWTTKGGSNFRLMGSELELGISEVDGVPYGGKFPIVRNLPEISVTDFIKTLNLMTGTFPLQKFEDGKVHMVAINSLWDNIGKAVDWSRYLVPMGGKNTPRLVEFTLEDWAQHNRYKWKEDEGVTGNGYNGDLRVENETLEREQTKFELPFAATNGDQIILLETEGEGGTFMGGSQTATTQSTGTSSRVDVEPRIMGVVEDAKGKAQLTFNIDLQGILDGKYKRYAGIIARPYVVTEWLYLRDVDILRFDESVPVYLAQYGAYFAVLELKVNADGYTEAKMIKVK